MRSVPTSSSHGASRRDSARYDCHGRIGSLEFKDTPPVRFAVSPMSSPLARALRREVNLGRAGGTLWRWWLAEMRAMLGDGALARLLRTSPSVAVAVDGDAWRLLREARGGGGAADEIGLLDRGMI